jgi:hypothetical protein
VNIRRILIAAAVPQGRYTTPQDCAVEPQTIVRCQTDANHGFRMSASSGELW